MIRCSIIGFGIFIVLVLTMVTLPAPEGLSSEVAKSRVIGAKALEGSFELDKPVIVKIPPVESIEFYQARDELRARLWVKYPSYPKIKWRVITQLLNEDGKVVGKTEAKFESSGSIERYPLLEEKFIHLSFGKMSDISQITLFRLCIVEIKEAPEPLGDKSEGPDEVFKLKGRPEKSGLEGAP